MCQVVLRQRHARSLRLVKDLDDYYFMVSRFPREPDPYLDGLLAASHRLASIRHNRDELAKKVKDDRDPG